MVLQRFCIFISGIFASSTLWAQAFCIIKSDVKIYGSVDRAAKVMAIPTKYTPLMGTGNKRKQLIEVTDMDSQKYWVHRKDVSSRLNCLAVRVKRASLRMGPGAKYKPAKHEFTKKNDSFIDLGGEDGWTQVKDEAGNTAWIDLENVWKPRNRLSINFDN